jgi:hypothetical protein
MSRRAGSPTPFVLGFLVLAGLTLGGNWRLDVERRAGRQSATSINDELRLAEQGLLQLRGAQAGYLAVGQNAEEWMNKATGAATQMESAVSTLAGSATSSTEARQHYQQSATLVADVTANDRKARGFIESGQPLVASDVLFQEGAEPARKLGVELASARDAEMASFEKAAAKFGWMSLGGNGAAFAIGLLLLVMASRTRKDIAAEPTRDGLNLNAGTDAPAVKDKDTTSAPPAPEPAADPFGAPSVDLSRAAELCVDLGRILDGRDLQALIERAADVLEAKGLVLWVSESGGSVLRPAVAHGYSDRTLQRMGTLSVSGDNVTSLAFRTLQPQVVRGPFDGHGALAVPLITASGCVGVLAAEVQGAKPGDVRFAVARMIAAQLSTLVGPGSIAPSKTANVSN